MKEMDKIFRNKLYNHASELPSDMWSKIETGLKGGMDNILRNKLYDHPSELPASMWANIEAGIKEENKDRGFFWYYVAGLAVVLLLTSYFIFIGTSDPVNTVGDPQEMRNFDDINRPQNPEPSEVGAFIPLSKVIHTNDLVDKPDNLGGEEGIETQKEKVETSGHSANTFYDPDEKIIDSYPVNLEKESKVDDEKTIVRKKNTFDKIAMLSYGKFDIDRRRFKDPIGCPTFSGSSNNGFFYVEAHAGPLLARPIISSNSPEVGSEYIDLRKSTESPLFSWAAGMNIGWISPYQLGAKAGVNYEVINERFDYQDSVAVRNQTIIVIDTIFNPDGSTSISMDTTIQQIIGYERQKIHNYHRSIEIPIHISYYFDLGKMDFEVSGGPNFNLTYTNRGKIVDPSNEDRWFTNGENGSYNVFKDRLSWSFSLDVSALYNLNENIQIYARPNFKFHPNSMTNTNSPFNQNYMNFGLSVGVRYYISANPYY